VISKRSAETVVVTPNGKTVVIGGLMQNQRIDSVQKIPILGDIPILGFPFRRTIKSDEKKELMIFLTPTIVSDPHAVDAVNADELGKTELVDRAFTEKEKSKFLQGLPLMPEPEFEPDVTPAPRATAVRRSSVTKAPTVRASKPAEIAEPEVRKPAATIRAKATPF
jgi:Flp pilus assembly secretin CpaC